MTGYPGHPAANLFPLLADEPLRELAADIASNGLIEPIWLYEDPDLGTVVLDGRNRLAACELASVEPRFRFYEGDDPVGFSVSQNLHRRHLTAGQRGMLALDIEPMLAHEAEARRLAGVKQEPLRRSAQRSDERAAKVVGTSGRVVSQAKRVAERAPDLAEKVKSGELAIDRADRIIRDRDAEQRRVDEAKQQAAALPVKSRLDIRHGDFREVLADLRNVDAIITDPPYPAEFLPLLDDLATWADTVLSPDGVMAVLMGQTHLPEVYRRLQGGRPYRWTACLLTPGAGYASMPRRLQSNWKPILIYGGGPRLSDVVRSEGTDSNAKSNHKWGQDYAAFHTLVERLTKPGQTVVDPFMGSGTTLLAAHALGRHAIGADLDPESVATARRRVA